MPAPPSTKVAVPGSPVALKLTGSPSGSVADTVNESSMPSSTDWLPTGARDRGTVGGQHHHVDHLHGRSARGTPSSATMNVIVTAPRIAKLGRPREGGGSVTRVGEYGAGRCIGRGEAQGRSPFGSLAWSPKVSSCPSTAIFGPIGARVRRVVDGARGRRSSGRSSPRRRDRPARWASPSGRGRRRRNPGGGRSRNRPASRARRGRRHWSRTRS